MAKKRFIVGNWKMNGGLGETALASAIAGNIAGIDVSGEVVVCPPFILLTTIGAAIKGTKLKLGAQDCHFKPNGAHTGDISVSMLKEIGAEYVIVGHSERRANHDENDKIVAQKAAAAIDGGLCPIICVGETLDERESGKALAVVLGQVENSVPANASGDNFLLAYEPVWAIGTGKVAGPIEIAEIHQAIEDLLVKKFGPDHNISILYGGSVNAKNAAETLATQNVGGALVGGASLKADDFTAIIKA